jgi:mono/diheme cytochrome c family protein
MSNKLVIISEFPGKRENNMKLVYTNKLLMFFCILGLGSMIQAADTHEEIKTEHYRVIGNQVDGHTFLGWLQYNSACISCHGPGGSGTEIAPDLTASIRSYNPTEFEAKVLQRYTVTIPGDEIKDTTRTAYREAILAEISKQEMRDAGELETMPMWKHDPAVSERIQALYSYLKARSDDVIGPDRIELLSE